MGVQLLDKTRKINKLLHNNNSHKFVFNDICKVLSEILLSNILVISKKGKVLGVSVCIQEENWRYYIAVSSDADTGNRLEEYVVPAATWAIFSGAGTGISIQELERRIATEWLPTSGYEFADAPDIEVYFEPDPQDTRYEVWVPVRRA